MTEVVPFFPFTEVERMVVVQQELLSLKKHLAKPANQKIGRTFGNITLELQDQPEVRQQFLSLNTYCMGPPLKGLKHCQCLMITTQLKIPVTCCSCMQRMSGICRMSGCEIASCKSPIGVRGYSPLCKVCKVLCLQKEAGLWQ